MISEQPNGFETDPFMERLLRLRRTDRAQFDALHESVKEGLVRYERRKARAQGRGDLPTERADEPRGN